MLRTVAAVIAGYVVMAAFVFLTFSGLYLAIGADRAFEPGSYQVSLLWIGASVVLGLVAAWLGGRISAAIGKGPRAPRVLAGIVLVLGLALAVPILIGSAPAKGPRTEEVSNLEAMAQAETPAWVALLNPLVGAAGVLLGARGRRRT